MAKRKCLTITQKLNLINEVEEGYLQKKDLANKYGIPSSTLSTILKHKNKIRNHASVTLTNQKNKKIRSCDHQDIEDAMLTWVRSAKERNLPISGPLVQEKAKHFAVSLGHADFVASNGWLHKFKKRHDIVGKVMCGEGADVNKETVQDWKTNVLPNLIKGFSPKNIFNADETGLFFKCLPSRTLTFKNEKCFGGKKSKERVTVLVGSNLTGTEKLKLLIIGKSKSPRCFKHVKSLPVDYAYNKKSWMTSAIFEEWLMKLDKKFRYEKRNVLLFVDNCPSHPKNVQEKLKNIELAFFPPNLTSSLQPMDQGIINNLKTHYRRRILKTILECSEENVNVSISLLDAIRHLNKSWLQDVKAETISNCFKKAGFAKHSPLDSDSSDSESNIPLAFLPTNTDLQQLWSKCTEGITDVSLDDFLNVDNDVLTTDHPTDEDILRNVMQVYYGVDDSEEEDEDDVEVEEYSRIPSFSETRATLKTLLRFVESRNNVPDCIFNKINSLEAYIDNESAQTAKQTTIDNFFITE